MHEKEYAVLLTEMKQPPLNTSLMGVIRAVADYYGRGCNEHPQSYTSEPWGVGPKAYEKWVKAIEDGHGSGHGAW